MLYSEYLEKLKQVEKYKVAGVDGYRAILRDLKDGLTLYKNFEGISNVLYAVATNNFKELRKAYKGDVLALSNDLQIPVTSLYNWERGVRKPPKYS